MDNKKKRILDRNLWWSFVIKEFSKEKPSKKFLNELTKDYWEMVIQKGKLYKDAPAVLTYLKNKGYILGLLTDTDGTKGFKSKRIKSLNFKKWFKTVVIAGEDTKQIKPDKAPLSLITRRLNLKPEECIFVGNDPYVDISGAKRLGMATIFINRHSSKIEVKPDRTITTLNELKQIL
jgi:putative hydrolase of the HAD superfamily